MSLVQVLVSGQFRTLPRAHWDALEGPKPPDPTVFACNGCTLSPDYVAGKRVWPACVLHDYHYNEATLRLSRKEADALFRRNVQRSLAMDGMFSLLAHAIALFYWRAVRRAGHAFYNAGGDPA